MKRNLFVLLLCTLLLSVFPVGVAAETVQISDRASLLQFRDRVNGGETDLDAELTGHLGMWFDFKWQPIGTKEHPYRGTFTGNGYTIDVLYDEDTMEEDSLPKMAGGFFGYTEKAEIRDVTINDAHIGDNAALPAVGAVVAVATDTRLLQVGVGPYVSVGVSAGDVGGIVGHISGTAGEGSVIRGCFVATGFSYTAVSTRGADAYAGGIAGRAEGNVTIAGCRVGNCVVFSEDGIAGGFVGYLGGQASVANCFSVANDFSVEEGYSLQYGEVAGVAADNGAAKECFYFKKDFPAFVKNDSTYNHKVTVYPRYMIFAKEEIVAELNRGADETFFVYDRYFSNFGIPMCPFEQFAFSLYGDVPKNSWYAGNANWATWRGITMGTADHRFSPQKVCTRAEMATFLYRFCGEADPPAATSFTDVKKGKYYYKAVCWAEKEGLVKGTAKGKFSPGAPITRAQLVTMLARLFDATDTAEIAFKDVPKGAYYYDAVCWAVGCGLTKGLTATTFAPHKGCTRAEIVTFLRRLDTEF